MGKNTAISWCDHTFNCWWGCAKVSEGCKNCYAETFAGRFGVRWGATSTRRFFGEKHWSEPRKWNSAAQKAGVRARVFCASMADVFEDGRRRELEPQRRRLFDTIEITEHLDWLLLTKRPENLSDMLPKHWLRSPRSNVWLGTTIENSEVQRDRASALAEVPAALHFWSCEPLLESLDILCPRCSGTSNDHRAGDGGGCSGAFPDWVIVGGESGSHARPFHVEWARSIVKQCRDAGVACFMKQMGANFVDSNGMLIPIRDRAGSDPSEWPNDLRVQEMPKVST